MIVLKLCVLLLLGTFSVDALGAEVFVTGASTYRKTKVRVERVLDDIYPDSAAWVHRSRHNGWRDRKHYNRKRDNVLMVPNSATPSLTLIVWLHGLGGFNEKTFRRVFSQIREISDRGYSVAVAIPEMPWSTNTTTKRSRQSKVWRRSGAFKGYVEDTLNILYWHFELQRFETLGEVQIVVVGHSAGGSAIASASIEGSICKLNVTNVIWSDATYGSWLKRSHRGCLGRGERDIKIIVRKWDRPYHRARRFLKSLKNHSYDFRVLPRRKYRHSRIGNEALLLSDLFPIGC